MRCPTAGTAGRHSGVRAAPFWLGREGAASIWEKVTLRGSTRTAQGLHVPPPSGPEAARSGCRAPLHLACWRSPCGQSGVWPAWGSWRLGPSSAGGRSLQLVAAPESSCCPCDHDVIQGEMLHSHLAAGSAPALRLLQLPGPAPTRGASPPSPGSPGWRRPRRTSLIPLRTGTLPLCSAGLDLARGALTPVPTPAGMSCSGMSCDPGSPRQSGRLRSKLWARGAPRPSWRAEQEHASLSLKGPKADPGNPNPTCAPQRPSQPSLSSLPARTAPSSPGAAAHSREEPREEPSTQLGGAPGGAPAHSWRSPGRSQLLASPAPRTSHLGGDLAKAPGHLDQEGAWDPGCCAGAGAQRAHPAARPGGARRPLARQPWIRHFDLQSGLHARSPWSRALGTVSAQGPLGQAPGGTVAELWAGGWARISPQHLLLGQDRPLQPGLWGGLGPQGWHLAPGAEALCPPSCTPSEVQTVLAWPVHTSPLLCSHPHTSSPRHI